MFEDELVLVMSPSTALLAASQVGPRIWRLKPF